MAILKVILSQFGIKFVPVWDKTHDKEVIYHSQRMIIGVWVSQEENTYLTRIRFTNTPFLVMIFVR